MDIVLVNKDSMFFVAGGFNKKNFRELEEGWSLFSNPVVVEPEKLPASSSFLITI